MKADPQILYSHVKLLAGIEPPRNYRNRESLDRAAEYIATELSKTGTRVYEQPFTANGSIYRNVIGSLGPENGPLIVVGAHYDVAGDQPGADDNASAVAGLLETARLIAHREEELSIRLELVAYCLEEPPFFCSPQMGSAVHAAHLAEKNTEVELMVCYEMIGYFTEELNSQSYPAFLPIAVHTDRGDFIAVVGLESQGYLAEHLASQIQEHSLIEAVAVNFPSAHGVQSLSDHKNYWAYGYPAVMLTDTSFLRNPHYHQETDTPDTLDYKLMAEVVNGMAAAVLNYSK